MAKSSGTKKCRDCKLVKNLVMFGKRKDSLDGHNYICKPCVSLRTKKWQSENDTKRREYIAKYNEKNRATINKKARIKYNNDPDYFKTIQDRYRKRNRDKHLARSMVFYQIKKGRIVVPIECSECGSIDKLHAHHHKGYAKEHWYDVIFLCSSCHGLKHRVKVA